MVRMIPVEVRTRTGPISQDLKDNGNCFGFYAKCNGTPLRVSCRGVMTEFHLRKNIKAAVCRRAVEYGGSGWKLGKSPGVYCSKQASDVAVSVWSGSREMGANSGKTGSHGVQGSAFSQSENLKFILEVEKRVKLFMDLDFFQCQCFIASCGRYIFKHTLVIDQYVT